MHPFLASKRWMWPLKCACDVCFLRLPISILNSKFNKRYIYICWFFASFLCSSRSKNFIRHGHWLLNSILPFKINLAVKIWIMSRDVKANVEISVSPTTRSHMPLLILSVKWIWWYLLLYWCLTSQENSS